MPHDMKCTYGTSCMMAVAIVDCMNLTGISCWFNMAPPVQEFWLRLGRRNSGVQTSPMIDLMEAHCEKSLGGPSPKKLDLDADCDDREQGGDGAPGHQGKKNATKSMCHVEAYIIDVSSGYK